jgi:hypothetical protein
MLILILSLRFTLIFSSDFNAKANLDFNFKSVGVMCNKETNYVCSRYSVQINICDKWTNM